MLLERDSRQLRRRTLAKQLAKEIAAALDEIDTDRIEARRLTIALPFRLNRSVSLRGRRARAGYVCDVGKPVLVVSAELTNLLDYLSTLRAQGDDPPM